MAQRGCICASRFPLGNRKHSALFDSATIYLYVTWEGKTNVVISSSGPATSAEREGGYLAADAGGLIR